MSGRGAAHHVTAKTLPFVNTVLIELVLFSHQTPLQERVPHFLMVNKLTL
jgi:hypothetical protein